MSTDGKTRISYAAILTTFNAEDFIDQAIQSILNQDIKASEIWIIDDCSTDNSLVNINSWADKNNTIKVIRNGKNSGQSFGRNFAGFNSKSELLIFFDDDETHALTVHFVSTAKSGVKINLSQKLWIMPQSLTSIK